LEGAERKGRKNKIGGLYRCLREFACAAGLAERGEVIALVEVHLWEGGKSRGRSNFAYSLKGPCGILAPRTFTGKIPRGEKGQKVL